MHKLLGNIIFYLAVGIPAYVLIIYGLRGIGILPVYGYTNYSQTSSFDLINFSPDPLTAPYFIFTGSGIISVMILRAIIKYRRK